jgi:hypothetical protein
MPGGAVGVRDGGEKEDGGGGWWLVVVAWWLEVGVRGGEGGSGDVSMLAMR